MARPDELVRGNCYFLLNYHDDELLIPAVQTLLFHSLETWEDGSRRWLFLDPENSEESESNVPYAFADADLARLLDIQGLRRELGALVPLHPLTRSPPRSLDAERIRTEIAELEPVLDKLLTQGTGVSVTLTIKYLDLGLSFGRRKGRDALEADLFIDLHDERQPERRLRDVFASLGLNPSQDYLAQTNRVRILSHPVPEDRDVIRKIAYEVLIGVFGMRVADELQVDWLGD
jgi:hypothetical protein